MSSAMLAGIFSVFAFGVVLALLGSIKLRLAPRIGADDAQFGKIVAVFQWTMVFMAIIGGMALDHFGHRAIITAGFLLGAVALFLIGRSSTIGAVMASCVILGIAGQFVNVGGNTLIPALFDDPATGSNLGNTFFGLGALLVPIVVAYLFKKTSYGNTLTVLAVVLILPVVFPLLGELPQLERTFSPEIALGLLGNLVTWLAALTLFCYIGLEVSMAVWITSYAAELGADETRAARMLSLFFVAMMLSRLFFGLQHTVTGIELTPIGGYVLTAGALLGAVAISIMKGTDSLGTARWAVIMTGAVFGPMFPTTVGVTFRHFDPSQWGTLFGVIFGLGLIGASTLPAWIGSLAKGKSVRSALNILRVTALALAVIAFILGLV